MADAPAPRKRGRPPKPGGPKKKEVVLDASGKPRGRGRPRKNPIDAPSVTTKSKAAPAADPSQPKRGRGRPRKSDVAATKTAPAAATPSKPAGKRGRPPKKAQQEPLHIASIVGRYSVRCEQIEQEWPDQAEDLELRIVPRNDHMLAAFDFGIIQGAMLLAPTKAALDTLVDRDGKGTLASEASEEESSEEDEDEDEEEEANGAAPILKTKKKSDYLESGRVLFKWRGEETGTGQIYLNNSAGHLEFDADGTTFVGYGSFPACGENCKFTGTRVPGPPGPVPEWESYSEKEAEARNKNRWK